MAWDLRYGAQLEWFNELEAEGEDVPALASKPEILPDLAADYMAFIELAASRTAGFSGAEPLRFSELLAFMQINGIDGLIERKHFVRRMRQIDRIYLKLAQQKKTATGGRHGK